MEMNGHECVAFCEIDKYARQSYKAIYDTKGEEEWHDITQVTDGHIRQLIRDRGHIDCICGGFPCQSFSIAGKRGGFADTRGTLFFEIMRIASIVRPRYLFLENVKGLLNHDGGATFETILNTLDEAGYDAEWSCINSKHHGVAQSRERVFIVGHNRDGRYTPVFPIQKTTTGILKGIQADTSGKGMHSQQDRFYLIDGIMCCLPNARAKTKCCFVDKKGEFKILTAKERMRLQGFSDEATERALKVVTPEVLSEQAGNSVTVNVIDAIARRMT